jgi:pSer/pThr/pTyr-binding forkhead associated (FHA) protein
MAKLVLKYQGVLLHEYSLDEGRLTVGRTEGNDVRIDHPPVSSKHARLDFTENGFVLTDLESRNGTFVNGKKVGRVVLVPNDWISVGSHVLIFKDGVVDRRGDTDSIQTKAM